MSNERLNGQNRSKPDWTSPEDIAARHKRDPRDPAFLSAFFDFQQVAREAVVKDFLNVIFSRKLSSAEKRPLDENERLVDQYQFLIAESERSSS